MHSAGFALYCARHFSSCAFVSSLEVSHAFLHFCGASVEAGAKFCGKCGASMTGAAPAAPSAPAAQAPAKGGGGVLKVVLIILGILVLFVVVIFGAIGYVGYRGYKAVKEEQAKLGEIKVEMPTGTVSTTTTDATKMAEQMGVEVYPGAEPQKGGGAVSMGGFSVAGADFLTSDPPPQVADFYKKHYPKAMVVSGEGDHYSIMVTTSQGMVTVAIEPYEGRTKISMAHMAGAKPPGPAEPN